MRLKVVLWISEGREFLVWVVLTGAHGALVKKVKNKNVYLKTTNF